MPPFSDQTVRGINIAGDAVPVHVDGRRGVDGEVFRDAVEQRDLAFLIVQDLLHRFILRPAALRDVVCPAASFAVLRDVGGGTAVGSVVRQSVSAISRLNTRFFIRSSFRIYI